MKKAVFLDRDGTIIEEKNYLNKTEDVVLLKNALEGLKLLQDNGYLLFIISNQSGVARGYFTEETVVEINNYLEELLRQNDIIIEHTYYCPHYKNGIIEKYKIDCECRKPKIGMITKALNNYDINISKSYVIGDKISDMKLANNCGCNSVLVLTGHGKDEVLATSNLNFDIATDLLFAAQTILMKE